MGGNGANDKAISSACDRIGVRVRVGVRDKG